MNIFYYESNFKLKKNVFFGGVGLRGGEEGARVIEFFSHRIQI